MISGTVHGDEEIRARLGRMVEKQPQYVERAVNRTALYVERQAKENLLAKVYSKPDTARYKKTGTLLRSVHANTPSATHEHDQGTAALGQDLSGAALSESATERTDHEIKAQVGTWLVYGELVEEQNPYLQPAYEKGEDFFLEAMDDALEATIRASL